MQQRNLPLAPQAVPDPKDLPQGMLIHCKTWGEAVMVGIDRSYYVDTQKEVAESLGIDPGDFNRMLNKKGVRRCNFPIDRLPELEQVLGNRAPSQWVELASKRMLSKDTRMTEADKARAYDEMMRRAG